MGCTECGDKPEKKHFTNTVIEINNPEQLVLLRKVVVPASLGDEEAVPPAIGKYRNVILQYEVNGHIYIYSSDGIPTSIEASDVPQDILDRLDDLEAGLVTEETERELADASLSSSIESLSSSLSSEATTRQAADNNLQGQIDAITVSSDVKDVVGTKAQLNNYDTSTLGDNDIIKVLQDESENDATTYYRWNATTQQFVLIGSEGPYYTKSQSNALLNAKQDTLTAGANVQISNNTISATDTTYTAGNGLSLNGTQFSVDTTAIATQSDLTTGLATKQNTLTAGSNVQISNDTISATDTTYTAGTGLNLTGTQFSVNTTTIAEKSDIPTKTSDLTNDGPDGSHAFVDTSTFEANSDKQSIRGGYNSGQLSAFGSVALGDAATASAANAVAIGARAHAYGDGSIAIGSSHSGQGTMPVANDNYGIAMGHTARAGRSLVGEQADYAMALGASSAVGAAGDVRYSVALGAYSLATQKGQVDISTLNAGTSNTHGYNGSTYRLLTGLYDPQSAHDAATKGYVDGTTETYAIATSDWSALSASSPYDYQATVTATYTIGANTIAELLNDSPVDFATHGFAIGSISGQSVTVYSIGQPSASVSLKVNYKG